MHKLFCFSTDFVPITLQNSCTYCKCAWFDESRLILSLGAVKNRTKKQPIFHVFGDKNWYNCLFLNWFSSKRAQNSCIAQARVGSEPELWFRFRGAVKIEKYYIFHVFGHKNASVCFSTDFLQKGRKIRVLPRKM